MSTKNLYRAALALMALNVVVTSALIFFMPDEVPVHWGANGEIDRVGSRYENFILPALSVALGLFLVLLAKYGNSANERTLLKLTMGMQVCLTGTGVFLFANALAFDGGPLAVSVPTFDMNRIFAVSLGILMVLMGNIMPKTSRNATFGLRTPWSQSSDENWQASQRIGGYAGILTGVIVLVCGFVLPSDMVTYVSLGLSVAMVVVCIAATYVIYRKNGVQ